jgi:hypothetical protein
LVIDGYREKCCEKIVNEAKGRIKAVINVEDVLKEHKDLQPESRAKLGPKGMKLAEIVGEMAAKKVDEILAEVNKSGR